MDNNLLCLFYRSVFISIISYHIVCFGGLVAKGEKNRIDRIIRKAERIVGKEQLRLDSVYRFSLQRKPRVVMGDESHPFHPRLANRVIARSGRLRPYTAATSRFRNSFIPRAISHVNSTFER